MKIYYCDECGKRVPEEELESGKALIDADDKGFCAECMVALNKPRPQSKRPPTRGYALPGKAQLQSAVRGHATPGNGNPTLAHPHAHAHAEHKQPHDLTHSRITEKHSLLPHFVLGGAVVVVLISISFIFKSPPPNPAPPARPPTVQTPVPPVPTPPTVVTPPPPPPTLAPPKGGLFGEMASEHARETDPEVRKLQAASKLKSAREFFEQNPRDPWTYLDMLRAVPDRTLASDEAAAAIAALSVPTEKSRTPGWPRDWKIDQSGADALVKMIGDASGKTNVLKTVPPSKDSEVSMGRAFKLPSGNAALSFDVHANDPGEFLAAVEVNGRLQASFAVKGSNWRTLELNLSTLAGQSANVVIHQIPLNAATPIDGTAFWTEPLLNSAHVSSAVAADFNPNAPQYSRFWGAVLGRNSAKKFKAPVEWVESARWKTALNLLGLADPKTGAKDSTWRALDSGGLVSSKGKVKTAGARIEIPYTCPPEYDVRATFERMAGNSDAVLILPFPTTKQQFTWQIGAFDNRYAAIAEAGGKRFDGNPAAVNAGRCLENKRKYTTVVEVRKDRVSAYLDGRMVVEWVPQVGALKLDPAWKINDVTHLGLGAWQSEIAFYSFELSEVK